MLRILLYRTMPQEKFGFLEHILTKDRVCMGPCMPMYLKPSQLICLDVCCRIVLMEVTVYVSNDDFIRPRLCLFLKLYSLSTLIALWESPHTIRPPFSH